MTLGEAEREEGGKEKEKGRRGGMKEGEEEGEKEGEEEGWLCWGLLTPFNVSS